jgi:hypothetical protein
VEQLRQYDERASFEVVGSDTGKRYRICKGHIYNVQELDECGLTLCSWCIAADGIPVGDINLAQKIVLETFESEILATANRTTGNVWPSTHLPSTRLSWFRR